jgi:hypothetical protein
MKKKTVLFALALTLVFTSCARAQQYDSPSDFRVSPLDGGKSAEITEYVGNKQTVNIPPRIEGMPITQIGGQAFYSKELIRITIPNTVTVIEYSAFRGNRFTSITLPGGLTVIGDSAFANCTNLTSITLPASITTIEGGTFQSCTSLTSITLPAGVTSIGSAAFDGCTSITSITIPAGVTSIGYAAFNRWTSSQTIYIKGHASQAAADAAWGMRGGGWRDNCNANIVYGQ